MSMTFWAHTKSEGRIATDHVDRDYIYEFLDQLDALCQKQQFAQISELCDYSESLSEDEDYGDELDEYDEDQDDDYDSVDDINWMPAHDARDLLIYLLNALENDPSALDIEDEEYDGLCEEIRGCLEIVDSVLGEDADALFNLSLTM